MNNILQKIRSDFEILNSRITYLDSGASSLTPDVVLASMDYYYREYRANVHRGIYSISERATTEYENARQKTSDFIGANRSEEIIFTRGATDGLNMLSEMLISQVKEGQNIIIPVTEHHSNMLPWRELARKCKLEIIYIYLKDGVLDEEALIDAIDEHTAIVVIGHISNVLGSIHNVKAIANKAHRKGALCIVDGAQAVPHIPVSMKDLGVNAYVFSGHKLYGPTGVGVLWVDYNLLKSLTPTRTGGDMVDYVNLETVEYAPIPQRFEAGTPPIADVIGLARAIDWIQNIGWDYIHQHEQDLVQYIWDRIESRPWLKILGGGREQMRIACFSFVMDNIHTHDIAYLLAKENICVRSGQHCASGIAQVLGITGSTRATFGIYNTREEVDILMQALDQIYTKFQ
ncbi:MAG: cysteine desulfurase [Candidatus Paceibacterota bacterium]